MTPASDEFERMRLSGYVELAAHGFALPAYGAGLGANAWYYAVPTVEGDHTSAIARFELLEDEEIVPVPDSAITVGPRDPWQDVFLWAGRVFTGTPSQILDAVAAYQDELRADAPLSYLDLAVAAEAPSSAELAAGALAFLERRLGGAVGAASFRELVLRPGVLIELRRQFRKANPGPLPDSLRDFMVRESGPGQFEVELVPGTTASVGGDPAAAELGASIARFGEILGLPLRATGLDNHEPLNVHPEQPAEETPPPPSYETVGRGTAAAPFPNILLIAADRRAAQIARYLEPPLEIAFGAGSIWGGRGYRIEHDKDFDSFPRSPDDALVRVVDRVDRDTPLESFAVIVWLAGNEVLSDDRAKDILHAVRSMKPDIPFLIAPAPPADGPSTLLSRDRDDGEILRQCNAIIDTTLARSPFWAGQPRRSVDRRMADIVGTVSVVAALDSRLRENLLEGRGSKRPRTLSFLGGSGRFNVEQATASELNTAGLDGYEGRSRQHARVAFEVRDRSNKRVYNAFVELQPVRQDFDHFAQAAAVEALGRGIGWPDRLDTTRDIPEPIHQTLDHPALAAAMRSPGTRNGPIVITAETPDLTSLRAADEIGGAVVRYTDVSTIRSFMANDLHGALPAEIRLPGLHRYPRNRGLATRGVDTRDIFKLPEDQWASLLSRHQSSDLGREARRYLAAIDTRGAEPEVALPFPAVWNAINVGDALAAELLERFPALKDEHALSGKRTGDLVAAWSQTSHGARRWVVEDGRIPVELTLLEPDSVPAQRLFLIDGDGAVPAFLLSRLFAVWARALLPSSTSWASRFQVGKTFEAFPFSWSFTIRPSRNGSPPHLRFSEENRNGTRLAELVGRDARGLAEVVEEFGHDERALRDSPSIREIDMLLLEDCNLSPEASDLDILEALIERNQERM